ncbi:hypothetical protein BDR26DRAFT_791861, partial [Obelidium mucronatum]
KAKCYPVIHELTGVAKSTYFSYMSFVRFIQDYPRFIHTSLSFNQIKLYQASIRDWFAAQDLRLTSTDFTAMAYWQTSLDSSLDINHLDAMN